MGDKNMMLTISFIPLLNKTPYQKQTNTMTDSSWYISLTINWFFSKKLLTKGSLLNYFYKKTCETTDNESPTQA